MQYSKPRHSIENSGFPPFRIAWSSYLEKELINFDANFKSIVSFLLNQKNEYEIVPDTFETNDGIWKTNFPSIEKIIEKKIPESNAQHVISFLQQEGAIRQDGIAFVFCPACGTRNNLEFRMEEKECCECNYRDNPDCDVNCYEYDQEDGKCSLSHFPKICCPELPSGNCPRSKNYRGYL